MGGLFLPNSPGGLVRRHIKNLDREFGGSSSGPAGPGGSEQYTGIPVGERPDGARRGSQKRAIKASLGKTDQIQKLGPFSRTTPRVRRKVAG